MTIIRPKHMSKSKKVWNFFSTHCTCFRVEKKAKDRRQCHYKGKTTSNEWGQERTNTQKKQSPSEWTVNWWVDVMKADFSIYSECFFLPSILYLLSLSLTFPLLWWALSNINFNFMSADEIVMIIRLILESKRRPRHCDKSKVDFILFLLLLLLCMK